MPSLFVSLLIVIGAAVFAALPEAGRWWTDLVAPGPALDPRIMAAGWSAAFLGQGLAAWQGWRAAGRHALAWTAGWVASLALWVAWSWALLFGHRPGWALGLLTLACCLQAGLAIKARGLGAATAWALLPAGAWLVLLWWAGYAWWRAAGGGSFLPFG